MKGKQSIFIEAFMPHFPSRAISVSKGVLFNSPFLMTLVAQVCYTLLRIVAVKLNFGLWKVGIRIYLLSLSIAGSSVQLRFCLIATQGRELEHTL